MPDSILRMVTEFTHNNVTGNLWGILYFVENLLLVILWLEFVRIYPCSVKKVLSATGDMILPMQWIVKIARFFCLFLVGNSNFHDWRWRDMLRRGYGLTTSIRLMLFNSWHRGPQHWQAILLKVVTTAIRGQAIKLLQKQIAFHQPYTSSYLKRNSWGLKNKNLTVEWFVRTPSLNLTFEK